MGKPPLEIDFGASATGGMAKKAATLMTQEMLVSENSAMVTTLARVIAGEGRCPPLQVYLCEYSSLLSWDGGGGGDGRSGMKRTRVMPPPPGERATGSHAVAGDSIELWFLV